jgi:hypothetical protein
MSALHSKCVVTTAHAICSSFRAAHGIHTLPLRLTRARGWRSLGIHPDSRGYLDVPSTLQPSLTTPEAFMTLLRKQGHV